MQQDDTVSPPKKKCSLKGCIFIKKMAVGYSQNYITYSKATAVATDADIALTALKKVIQQKLSDDAGAENTISCIKFKSK